MKRGPRSWVWIVTILNCMAALCLLVPSFLRTNSDSDVKQASSSRTMQLLMEVGGRPEVAQKEPQVAEPEERATIPTELLELTEVNPTEESLEQKEDRAKMFQDIWRTRSWGGGSRSGPGSDLEATVNSRQLISTALSELSITRLLDAPCGEANWLPTIDGIGTRVHYTGADIVPDAVVEDMRKYLNRPNMRFVNLDLAIDSLPKDSFDAIHCRDALQHLPIETCLDIIANFEQTGAKYLITNFYPDGSNTGVNLRTAGGGHFTIDPHKPPFNFSKPIMYIIEGPEEMHGGKHLGVYRLPVLHKGDGSAFVVDITKKHQVVHVDD